MAIVDKREPAVYITTEDVSYSAPALEVGRTVYGVILCDRGPHNRVVKVSSKQQYHKLFGTPNFRRNSQTFYQLDKALEYTGQVLLTRVTPADSYWANTSIKAGSTGTETTNTFTFTATSNTVTCTLAAGYDEIVVGQWVYPKLASADLACQVISKVHEGTDYNLILDRKYAGTTAATTTLLKYTPYTFTPTASVDSAADLSNSDTKTVFYFYANGAGKYYNSLILKGTRNTELEKYYIDDDGAPLYPYMFMDVGVYEVNKDGSHTLMEGPWTVSLIPRYPDSNQSVKDLTSGQYLFIEEIINTNSNLIRCIATDKDAVTGEPKGEYAEVTKLISDADATDKRLQVMLLLSNGSPVGTTNIAGGGAILENGTDGTGLYDTGGNLNTNDALIGLVAQAYNGSLTSVDGSVEQLPEVAYPLFTPDYITCGGFPVAVQYAAQTLATNRGDCICLADTGGYKTKYEDDITARATDVPWNTWNAMLYPQYRQIFDTYTGSKIFVSGVYHALERHLFCDAVYFVGEPVAG